MEIIYYYPSQHMNSIVIPAQIRWLEVNELELFNDHLNLCKRKNCSIELWNKIIQEGAKYCGYFIDEKIVARAAVEKHTTEKWEVSDVRVAHEYRNKGYAKQVCCFVLQYILQNNKTATIRTEEDNFPMQSVIKALGFIAQE